MDIHPKNIIHGDLKPENIVLTSEGKPLLTDFGISKKFHSFQSKVSSKGQTLLYSP